jgi:hypothetical protein
MLAPHLAVADSIDDYIRTAITQQRIPGLALAVIRDGRPVKVATYGLANVELHVPVTRRTVFRLASVSKQIIATGVMLLVADGKLTLDDPICTYLEQCPSAWRPITIQELLSHTSGLSMEASGNDPFTLESVDAGIRRAYSVPLRFKPGAPSILRSIVAFSRGAFEGLLGFPLSFIFYRRMLEHRRDTEQTPLDLGVKWRLLFLNGFVAAFMLAEGCFCVWQIIGNG